MRSQKELEKYVDLSALDWSTGNIERIRLFYRHFRQVRDKSLILNIKVAPRPAS